MKLNTPYSKALIVVHRSENAEDFREIARRMHKLDPAVAVLMMSDYVNSRLVPPNLLNLPMLVVYLVNNPRTEFAVAHKLGVRNVDKLQQNAGFIAAGVPAPPMALFSFGMSLDPAVYGETVVLKPRRLTSSGRDVNMIPTHMVGALRKSDFPQNHLIHRDEYLVQKFIRTGTYAVHYRVAVLLGEIIYSRRNVSRVPLPDLDSDIRQLLAQSVATNNRSERNIELYQDAEINGFALGVYQVHPTHPLQGIDIVREAGTGKLYALEANLGGNVWHFSSRKGSGSRFDVGGRNAMIRQYNAWDVAASALLRATHALAS